MGENRAEAIARGMGDPLEIDLPCEPEGARLARQELERFRGFLGETRFGDLRLLISELVVESVVGAGEGPNQTIRLRAECDGDRVRASVEETTGIYSVPSSRPEPGDQGWGVYLVERLSDCWGLRREGESTTVWLELWSGPDPSPQAD